MSSRSCEGEKENWCHFSYMPVVLTMLLLCDHPTSYFDCERSTPRNLRSLDYRIFFGFHTVPVCEVLSLLMLLFTVYHVAPTAVPQLFLFFVLLQESPRVVDLYFGATRRLTC